MDKIIKFSLYFLVFLLPLFWLPFSFEAYEFNKQYLLFFLVSISFLVWLAKMIFIEKEIRFRWTSLDLPVLMFLFVAILSAIFSVDKSSSLFGFYGRFSNGLIGLISLGLFYFLIINNVSPSAKPRIDTDKERINADTNKKISINQPKSATISGMLKMFFWSVFFVVLISYLSIFGVWAKIPKLPPIMLQRTFNPISGSLEGLAVFLSIVISLLVGLCLTSEAKRRWFKRLGHWVFLIAILGLLIIIDFSPSWIVLAVSLGLFLIFALATRIFRENVNRLLLPILLIFISIAGLVVSVPKQSFGTLPKEQVLGQGISWKTAFGAATENVKSGFLGSGIGTFHYDFAKFKPLEFNKNLWWQIRYDRAGSQMAETFGTMGFLGLISYFFLIGFFFLICWFLRKKIEPLPFSLTFLALFFSQIFYYQNLTLAFTFWFILGLGVVSWQKSLSEKVISFKDFPELSLVFSTLLILLCLGILAIYFFGVRFYLADANYLRAQLVSGEERPKALERVVNLNPKLATYRIVLARSYLWQIFEETAKPLAQQDSAKIQNLVARAIDMAKIASQISPNSVAAWETLGMIYRDIQPLAAGTTDWAIKFFQEAIKFFQEAIKLEPKNPVFYTEVGKLYLGLNNVDKARENFAKAKELKSDYLDALLQEALLFEREGNLDEAIKRLEELVINYSFNIELRFQLGRLYFNKDRVDDAILQFETVTSLFPNHSNSLYSLGLAYTKKGEKEKAIKAFERVLELNPGNQDVIQKLEELRK